MNFSLVPREWGPKQWPEWVLLKNRTCWCEDSRRLERQPAWDVKRVSSLLEEPELQVTRGITMYRLLCGETARMGLETGN